MGDYADMNLDGTNCEACSLPMGDGQSPGFPRYHKKCRPKAPPIAAKVKCDVCGRKVRRTGLADHKRDAHPVAA